MMSATQSRSGAVATMGGQYFETDRQNAAEKMRGARSKLQECQEALCRAMGCQAAGREVGDNSVT